MAATAPISRQDIETKLREINGEVRETASAAAPIGLAVGVAAAVVLLGAVYLLGRRKGRRRSTIVEIRRI